ncbi:MAG: hypothetical protein F6J90_36435 [Moorea sp. SIOASIH]|uniref:hypothetical protein n=1 Tax=Moorena sp. SIOASIH TaxID=2607817 RepID=UPI0013B7236D|nr:hypothetical protein [Moorena sp. SIOASIH]NEO41523.1 hypothetical protein [Moorena sp. SIOASIH]
MNKIEYSVNHTYVDHTYELHSIFYSRLPTPDSRLPTPDSLLPYQKVISIFMT